jgi:hypothetical protein
MVMAYRPDPRGRRRLAPIVGKRLGCVPRAFAAEAVLKAAVAHRRTLPASPVPSPP